MDEIDCVVVGAGVVGLAVARALARAGRDVVVLEKAGAIGTETSSRNSEVIHAGIYYRPGSLKARLCVEGRHRLYDHCETRGIGHARCGKLIVATTGDQAGRLEAIAARAHANGVDDLVTLTAGAARAMEPALNAVAALHSPSTGIVDSHGLMESLAGEAADHGAMIAFATPFIGARPSAGWIEIEAGGSAPLRIKARALVNAAGLGAVGVATRIEGLDQRHVPQSRFAKGNYFALTGRAPFSRLIYPVPEPGGLGVHLTLDLGGQARFGPDVEWLKDAAYETLDYAVSPTRAAGFEAAIRDYWPELPCGALVPAYSGVRPKVAFKEDGDMIEEDDFTLQDVAVHGLTGLINLFGIESPGLTACLAIADRVEAALRD